jgi:hypothetical protein
VSGICCFTRRQDFWSIRKLFFLAWRLTCDTVAVVPFSLIVFTTVVRASTPGCGWLLTGG